MGSVPLFRLFSITGDGALVAGSGLVKFVVLNAGADPATLTLHDATGATNAILDVHAPAGGCSVVDLTVTGGIPFGVGCYGDIGGASAGAFVWLG